MVLLEEPFDSPCPGKSIIRGLLNSESGSFSDLTNLWSMPAPAIKSIDFFSLSIDSKFRKYISEFIITLAQNW